MNTGFHASEEITAVIPEIKEHGVPDIRTGYFTNWIDFVVSSQGIMEWHELQLSDGLVKEVLGTHISFRLTGRIKEETMEDLVDLFPNRTTKGENCSEILNRKVGRWWFLRLDFCSTKDAVMGGGENAKVVGDVEDVIRRLVTSSRAVAVLEDHRSLVKEKKTAGKAKIFLLLFREDVKSGKEYRVFCPPSPRGLEDSRVTAVSQDRCHEQFSGSRVGETTEAMAHRVLDGILKIHKKILERAATSLFWLQFRMEKEGFVFDVFDPEDREVQFVEMNPFGAMSGCGSSLFHWIKDARVLYGFGGAEEVEFRVTTGSRIH